MLHGPGSAAARGGPLTRAEVAAVAEALGRSAEAPETAVLAFQVEGLGPVRATVSPAGVVLRLLGQRHLPAALEPLAQLTRGLVVLGGLPGSGRSTALVALLQRAHGQGRLLASLEEPVWLKLSTFQWDAGPGQEEAFVRAVRLTPTALVAFDLVDDARSVALALDAALEERLVLCTVRGSTLAEVLQRVAVLDASHHRRRVADHLAAVSLLDGEAAELLLPGEALRRHLRMSDAPPPSMLLE
jgi:Mrp family chromosome partitioning ATPase